MTFALGKRSARAGAVKLKFETYFDPSALPVPPAMFGRPWLISDWGILGNDLVGDCVWADAAHQTTLWNAEAGAPIPVFTDACVLADYAAETQKDDPPGYPAQDAGTDMQHAAAYRSKIGVADVTGKRHLTGPYVALQPGNIDQLVLATYLFGAVSVGIQLPASAFDQFDRAEPWEPVQGSPIEGGHCITLCGRNSHGMLLAVTWGRLHAVSPAFLTQYMDEGIAYLSLERIKGNVSPQGFNEEALQADLTLIQASLKPRETRMSDKLPAKDDTARLTVAVGAARQWLDQNAPGWVDKSVSDDELKAIATAILTADDAYQAGPSI